MTRFLLKRTLYLVFVIFGITLVIFLIANIVPGDPARMVAGQDAPPETVERIRKNLGLDQPLHVQYYRYMVRLTRGDLGRSFRTNASIADDLKGRYPATLELVAVALILLVALALPIGVYMAVHRFSPMSMGLRLGTFVAVGIPAFWLGLLLQIFIAQQLGWLPVTGRLPAIMVRPPMITRFLFIDGLLAGRWDVIRAAARHMVLPAIGLAIPRIAMVVRLTTAAMLDVLNSDYIRTARAKGLSQRVVVYKHALRNAMIPIITYVGLSLGYMLGGAVVIEYVFAWPGIGTYIVDSIKFFDYNVVMGGTLVIAVSFSLINLVVDILYSVIDPRITIGDN